MKSLQRTVPYQLPLNIYEVELGSFKKKENGDPYSYRELVDVLIPYVKEMNYTHIELLPITEYPYDKGQFFVSSTFRLTIGIQENRIL